MSTNKSNSPKITPMLPQLDAGGAWDNRPDAVQPANQVNALRPPAVTQMPKSVARTLGLVNGALAGLTQKMP